MTTAALLKMQRAGLSQEQVEAIAEFVSSELDLSQLATKADLAHLATKVELAEAKTEIVTWVVGVGFVQAVTLIGALLTFLKLFPGGHP